MKLPTDATLKKYGLLPLEWADLYNKRNGCCHICGRKFEDGKRVNVDHEHVKGWKHMEPHERKQFIRGLLCYTCNKFMIMKGMTSDKLWKGYLYMRSYEVRITAHSLEQQELLTKNVKKRRTNKPTKTTNRKSHE